VVDGKREGAIVNLLDVDRHRVRGERLEPLESPHIELAALFDQDLAGLGVFDVPARPLALEQILVKRLGKALALDDHALGPVEVGQQVLGRVTEGFEQVLTGNLRRRSMRM